MTDVGVRSQSHEVDATWSERVDTLLVERIHEGGLAVTGVSGELGELVDSLRRIASGGKRLRAEFCRWGGVGVADHDGVPGLAEAAAALEMFHLAALVHDDVMDRSASRRGEMTVHRRFTERHRDERLRGGAETFGDGVGVLVGDLALTWSDDLMTAATTAMSPSRATAVRGVWEQMRSQVLAGQYLDLLAQARPSPSPEDITRVLHYKSAKYTVEHPLLLGAAAAGAGPHLIRSYRDFGLRVGEAFQLRDDVLGVFGNADLTGKSSFDDVREGKQTLLMTLAEEAADTDQQGVLRRHVGDGDLDAAGLESVRSVLRRTGALDRVEERIARLVSEAFAVLDTMPVTPRARESLSDLTHACAWRAS